MVRLTFRLYDTAEHRYLKRSDVRIDGEGVIWYNNSRSRTIKIWEPLNESGEGMEIRDLKINKIAL